MQMKCVEYQSYSGVGVLVIDTGALCQVLFRVFLQHRVNLGNELVYRICSADEEGRRLAGSWFSTFQVAGFIFEFGSRSL